MPGQSTHNPEINAPLLRAVAVTVVPDAASLDEAGWETLERLVAGTLGDRPPEVQRRFRTFLRLVEWLPVLRYGRPFTRLNGAQRSRFLSSLQDHPLQLFRLGFWGLRTMVFLGYYGQPEIARSLGYTPDVRGWEAVR